MVMDDSISAGELLARMKQGQVEAAAALFVRYAGRFYRNARNHGFSHEDAEDVVQQTFHRIIERIDTYDESAGSGEQWMWRICRNAQIDIYRRRGRIVDLPPESWPEQEDQDTSAQERLEQSEKMWVFRRCWDRLSREDQKEIRRGRGTRGPERIKRHDAVRRLRTCMELAA